MNAMWRTHGACATTSNQRDFVMRDHGQVVDLSGGQRRIGLGFRDSPDSTILFSIAVTLDWNRLQFKNFEGRHMQQIVFLLTLRDAAPPHRLRG